MPSFVDTVTTSAGLSVIPVPGRSRVIVIVKSSPSPSDVDIADRVTVPTSMKAWESMAIANMSQFLPEHDCNS